MNLIKQEKDYYELIIDMLDYGVIDDSKRDLLNKRKSRYGISDERAKEIEDFALKENDNNLFKQGKSYYIDNNYEEAIRCFKKAVELNANEANIWHWLGNSYNQNGNYEEAIRCLEKAVELNPNDANNWDWLGYSYNKNQQFKEARNAYGMALEIDPNNDYYIEQFILNEYNANRK